MAARAGGDQGIEMFLSIGGFLRKSVCLSEKRTFLSPSGICGQGSGCQRKKKLGHVS